MKRILTGLVMVVAMLGMSGKDASATLINFDDVASGTNINNQYAGVTFNCVVCSTGNAYAVGLLDATHVNGVSLHSSDPTFAAQEGAVEAHFSTLQSSVSIDAKYIESLEYLGSPSKSPYLQAFDSSNTLLATKYYDLSLVPGTAVSGPWETLSINMANISYVRFTVQNNWAGLTCDPTVSGGLPGGCPDRVYGGQYGEFDNLVFGTDNTVNPPGGNGNGNAVPEPSSLILLGLGFVGLAIFGRNRFKTV
ncbi:MAG TPA: PEP-CTERM sorting domain-containing protein [Nitrospiria bacterium]|nr:PEP-CTERM sorting domain-containing protein [Nitrospiria bacterium]